VTAGMQVVERHYGMLELHSESQADVRQAGQAILDEIGLKEQDRHKPRVVANQVVRHLDDTQTMLINRFRHGNMILAGQTLFVLEVEPAGYAALAANEAEKAAGACWPLQLRRCSPVSVHTATNHWRGEIGVCAARVGHRSYRVGGPHVRGVERRQMSSQRSAWSV